MQAKILQNACGYNSTEKNIKQDVGMMCAMDGWIDGWMNVIKSLKNIQKKKTKFNQNEFFYFFGFFFLF